MRKRYDSYELEIIVSLGFLILFLISINFISGYSFENARRVQQAQFDDRLSLAANYAALAFKADAAMIVYSKAAANERLRSISIITGVKDITLVDTTGNVITRESSYSEGLKPIEMVTIRRALSLPDGKIIGHVILAEPNFSGARLSRLSRWDMIFRISGLAASLVVGAYFLRTILLPYRRIKHAARDYNLDLDESENGAGIEYIVGTFTNVISELEEKKIQLENLYRNSEKRADSLASYNEYILSSITSGVVICDSNGIVTRFNPSAQNILQYLEHDCRGKHYRAIFGNHNKLVSLFDDALFRKNVHSRQELEIRRPDGKKLWLGCSSSLINDERGEGMGAALLLIDLTEIRRLQEASSYAEKMVVLGETAAGLAHEVRNSFAAIIGFAKLLRKGVGSDKEMLRIVEVINDESISAEALMTRFLSFAKPLNVHPEPLNIKEMVAVAVESLTPSKLDKMVISTHIAREIPEIKGDPMLLRQAISNLIINACDALPDGGEIRIKAGIGEPEQGRTVFISVIDNGAGIKPELINKIFDPFISGKPDGTGLGLALVKKIVVLHGGRVEVFSRPGKGARFTIYLPLDEDYKAISRDESQSSIFAPSI